MNEMDKEPYPHPLDIRNRLDEFRNLKDGWLEGKGIAPSQEGLDWLTQAFEKHYPSEMPLPYLYPTAEGNVLAEWSIEQNEISLEIDLGKHVGEWHCLNMDTDKEDKGIFNLGEVNE